MVYEQVPLEQKRACVGGRGGCSLLTSLITAPAISATINHETTTPRGTRTSAQPSLLSSSRICPFARVSMMLISGLCGIGTAALLLSRHSPGARRTPWTGRVCSSRYKCGNSNVLCTTAGRSDYICQLSIGPDYQRTVRSHGLSALSLKYGRRRKDELAPTIV